MEKKVICRSTSIGLIFIFVKSKTEAKKTPQTNNIKKQKQPTNVDPIWSLNGW